MENIHYKFMVDVDSTLLDTGPHLLKWLQESFDVGLDVKYEGFTEFRFEKNFPQFKREMVEEIFSHEEFWLTIPSIPGASVFTELLSSLGEVILATDRFWFDGIQNVTAESMHNASIQYHNLHFVESKDKAKFASQHNVKLAFEDRLDNAIAISEFCPVGLIAQPYNDKPWGNNPIFRIAKDYIYPDLELAGDWAIFMHDLHNSFPVRTTCSLSETTFPPTGQSDRFAIKAQTEPPKPRFETILDEAKSLVYGDRQEAYNHPLLDFERTIGMLNGYLGPQLTHPLVAEDLPMIMNLVKISRAKNDINLNRPIKSDNLCDGAGYHETCSMVVKEKIRRGLYGK